MVLIWYITEVCEVLLFFFSFFLKFQQLHVINTCILLYTSPMHIQIYINAYACYAFYVCFVSCQDVEVKESKQVQRPTVTTVMETPSSMGDGGDQV